MSTITTSYFSKKIADAVKNEVANGSYYFAVSKFTPWTDENNPDQAIDTTTSRNQFKRELLLGKRIKESDIIPLVSRNFWTSGTVYAQYDDIDENLFEKKFYVVNSSDRVYKCLFNNSGAPSTSEPTLIQTDKFESADGYIWKYMYSISGFNTSKFSTGLYHSVESNNDVVSAASNGAIDIILITNEGSGYTGYISGTISEVISNSIFKVVSQSQLAPDNFYYNTSALYITDGTGEGQLTNISNYVVNSSGNFIYTEDQLNDPVLDITSTFRIAPQVKVTGDGVGARAICTVNADSSSYYIDSIDVLNAGENYSYANVQIISNPAYGSGAEARAVIPPYGGHGADPVAELNAKLLGFSVFISNNEGNTVATEVSFRQGGIVYAPEKYNLPDQTYYSFNSNSSVSNTYSTISFSSANTKFLYGDRVMYSVAAGNTAVDGLRSDEYYYVVEANSSAIKLSQTQDGDAISLTSGATETGHYIYTTAAYSANTFDALTTVNLVTGFDTFTENEVVTGSQSEAFGRVAFANLTIAKISMIQGEFVSNSTFGETLTGNTSGISATIDYTASNYGINNPDIAKGSVRVLHLDNIEYIQRSDNDNEQGYLIITL